jgi:hypothetical protein
MPYEAGGHLSGHDITGGHPFDIFHGMTVMWYGTVGPILIKYAIECAHQVDPFDMLAEYDAGATYRIRNSEDTYTIAETSCYESNGEHISYCGIGDININDDSFILEVDSHLAGWTMVSNMRFRQPGAYVYRPPASVGGPEPGTSCIQIPGNVAREINAVYC